MIADRVLTFQPSPVRVMFTRYRLRWVLADPGLRFETEVALRAAVLRERAERAVSRRRRREGRAHPGARP